MLMMMMIPIIAVNTENNNADDDNKDEDNNTNNSGHLQSALTPATRVGVYTINKNIYVISCLFFKM